MPPFETPLTVAGMPVVPTPTGFLAKRMRSTARDTVALSAPAAQLRAAEIERDLRRVELWIAEGKL